MTPPILHFSSFNWRHWVTLSVFLFAAAFALYSMWHFLGETSPKTRSEFRASPECRLILFFWTLGPPAWFFLEHYVLWSGDHSPERPAKLKTGRELAQPFWAAVLATLLFLIPKD